MYDAKTVEMGMITGRHTTESDKSKDISQKNVENKNVQKCRM